MKKFRKLGFINYNGEFKINNSLLNVVLSPARSVRRHGYQSTSAPSPGRSVKWKDV